MSAEAVDARVARPPRVPDPVFQAAGYFLPRLLFLASRYAGQVSWGDIALALDGFDERPDLGSAAFWAAWRERWGRQGDRYARLAEAAVTGAGRRRALRSAAGCYHWAEFMYFDDLEAKSVLRHRVRACFLASLEGGDLDLTATSIPLSHAPAGPPADPPAGQLLTWLILPPRQLREPGPLPCVVVCNGLDSMTEIEPLALAEAYLERGIAALLFEGPGQGLEAGRSALRPDVENVVAPLLDALGDNPLIDADRIAFLGISFGGYFALRVAQRLGGRLRGAVNISGGPVVAPFDGLRRRLKEDFRCAFGGGNAWELQELLDTLALDPSARPGCDVLSVHGGRDDIFPAEALDALDRAWGPRHVLVSHPDEAHVCLNLTEQWSQQTADWVAQRLLTISGPAGPETPR